MVSTLLLKENLLAVGLFFTNRLLHIASSSRSTTSTRLQLMVAGVGREQPALVLVEGSFFTT